MIKAVLFDVAGVLSVGYTHLIVDAARVLGADLDQLAHALLPVFVSVDDTGSMGHRLERGEVSLEEFLASLGAAEADARAILHPASDHFFGRGLHPQPAMHAFVDEVRAAGLRTAIVSNNVREWQPVWDAAIPPRDRFDAVVFSAIEGVRKPNPIIFERALDRLGITASEGLFLDDFEPMVDGARAVGLHAIHVADHDRAIAEARAVLGLSEP